MYSQPQLAADLLSRLANSNASVLESLKLVHQHSEQITSRKPKHLRELALIGAGDRHQAVKIWDAVWKELTVQPPSLSSCAMVFMEDFAIPRLLSFTPVEATIVILILAFASRLALSLEPVCSCSSAGGLASSPRSAQAKYRRSAHSVVAWDLFRSASNVLLAFYQSGVLHVPCLRSAADADYIRDTTRQNRAMH